MQNPNPLPLTLTSQHLAKPRVLVVDDDPEMIHLVEEVLALIDCHVLAAHNGAEALTTLRREKAAGRVIDAVLLDVVMPGADGFRILQTLKSDPELEQLPVILITALGSVLDKTRGLRMGADDYVTKPFDPQELLARIGAVFRIRRTEQMLRQRNQELAALNEINQMVSASLDLDQVLVSALEGLERLIQADALALVLNDEESGSWMIRTARAPEGTWLEGRMVPAEDAPLAETLARAEPLLHTQVQAGFWSEALATAPLDILCVPLLSHEEAVGLLVVVGREGALDEEYIPLLKHVAATVAIAVDNARLYGELAAFADELERSQSQLIQAEKMAAVGRLAASIAHEINNPLQAIQNSLHLSLHPNLEEEGRRRYLGMAQDEINRLVQIVRRMLDFYRPSSDIMESVDVNKTVENALVIANKRLQQANIRVVAQLFPNQPPVWGSANQLTQVFLNIIINAIEATDEGGTLWVGTAYHAERQQVVAAFRDSGPGISLEVREHLFEPFFTTKPTGTGLGLAISYGIVERHRGVIETESPPGGGATFIVRLPEYQEEDHG